MNIARVIFQALTFLIFVYQLYQSLEKYFGFPVVQQRSFKEIKTIQKPEIYICQLTQYNYTKGLDLFGYKHTKDLLSGNTRRLPTLSWSGKDTSLSYNELKRLVYDSNYTNFVDNNGYFSKNESFWLPHGYCKHLEKFEVETKISVGLHKRVRVIVVDPNKANRIRLVQEHGSFFEMGHAEDKFVEEVINEISFEETNEQIYEGRTCTDYEKYDTTYGDCVERKVEDQLFEWFGCIPPWFPTPKKKACGFNVSRETYDNKKKKINLELWKLLANWDMDAMNKCKPNCKQLKTNLKEINRRVKDPSASWLHLYFKKSVVTTTEAYSFDIFALAVEIGSALGLWLGLSVLSILDLIVSHAHRMKINVKYFN